MGNSKKPDETLPKTLEEAHALLGLQQKAAAKALSEQAGAADQLISESAEVLESQRTEHEKALAEQKKAADKLMGEAAKALEAAEKALEESSGSDKRDEQIEALTATVEQLQRERFGLEEALPPALEAERRGQFMVPSKYAPGLARACVGMIKVGQRFRWPDRATPLDHEGEVRTNTSGPNTGKLMEKPSLEWIPLDATALELLVAAHGKKATKARWPGGPVAEAEAMGMTRPASQKRVHPKWKMEGLMGDARIAAKVAGPVPAESQQHSKKPAGRTADQE